MATVYLRAFHLPTAEQESGFFPGQKINAYNDFYPFQLLADRGMEELTFEPITLLCGGNGSGKTTLLNVMAETVHATRDAAYNRSAFFETYTSMCEAEGRVEQARHKAVITSDDVFNFMLDLRATNAGIDQRREALFEEYAERKYEQFQLRSMEDYEHLKQVVDARRHTMSRYTRERIKPNIPEHSNGESAWMYFTYRIRDNGLYFLDEPENSLSPERQIELVNFVTESMRFYGCQFIIATHSPLLQAMHGARIYNLDSNPVQTCRWTDLPNVRLWHDFFKEHDGEFDGM